MPSDPSNPKTISSRQVWRQSKAGSLDRLSLREEPLAAPADDEVQVQVRAVGVNFADIFACLGLYSATPEGPFIPGLECAGTVIAVGAAVTDYRIGDRVIVLTRFGGYATHLNVRSLYLWPLPASWSFEQGAAYPVQALTAWYGLLPLGKAKAGSVVLVQSAAGGVGLHALRALGALGAHPVAVVGHPDKRDWLIKEFGLPAETVVLRDRGYAHALDRALQHLGAPGFDLVFDAVYGPWFKDQFSRLSPEGRYVLFGAAEFMSRGRRPNPLRLLWLYLRRPRLDPLAMISQNRGLLAFNLIWLWGQAERLPEAMRASLALIPEPPRIGAVHRFAAAHEALQALQSGKTTGKLLLRID
jgi:alcohol dehydrogenase